MHATDKATAILNRPARRPILHHVEASTRHELKLLHKPAKSQLSVPQKKEGFMDIVGLIPQLEDGGEDVANSVSWLSYLIGNRTLSAVLPGKPASCVET